MTLPLFCNRVESCLNCTIRRPQCDPGAGEPPEATRLTRQPRLAAGHVRKTAAVVDSRERPPYTCGMTVDSHQFEVDTQGNTDILNITDQVSACLMDGRVSSGIATILKA